jgi:glutamyl/glutaminyl-tRNA synthetase
VSYLSSLIKQSAIDHQLKQGQLLASLRLSLTGRHAGPGVADIIVALGINHAITRLRHAAITIDATIS